MMKVLRLVPLTAALALALAGTARAEGLLELYEAARAYDASWQSAKAQYEANLARAEQARAGLLPQAGLSAGLTRSALETNVAAAPVNPAIDRNFTTQQATLSASQPLYRPANLATWHQAQRQMQLAQYQLTAAGQDLMIRVSQAYFDVLAAQDTLAFVRAQKAATAEQLASAKRNFEVGTSTITDTREAQARYDLVQAQEIAAENDLRVKKLALDTLVGRDDAQPNPLAAPLDVPAPQPPSPEAWVAASEGASPAILQAKKAVEVAELETEKARAGHKPTLDLTTSYGISRNVGGSASLAGDSRSNNGNIGIAFNLPLFAGAAQSAFLLVFCLFYIATLSVPSFLLISAFTAVGLFIFWRRRIALNKALEEVYAHEAAMLDSMANFTDGFQEIRLNAGKNDSLFARFTEIVSELERAVGMRAVYLTLREAGS